MNDFALLYKTLDETSKTQEKLDAMAQYFASAAPLDLYWSLALLSGKKRNRPVRVSLIKDWASEMAGLPMWLFEATYHKVGDLSETMALVVPQTDFSASFSRPLHEVMRTLESLPRLHLDEQKEVVSGYWRQMNGLQRLVFNKLIHGGFRVGVAQSLVVRALGKALNRSPEVLAHRLMGDWHPEDVPWQEALLGAEGTRASVPYPFCLAHPLDEDEPPEFSPNRSWAVEWKWDGIRGQIIYREGTTYVWSRGEEPLNDIFPEITPDAWGWPDGTVVDGEIVAWHEAEDRIAPFYTLQHRLGRKSPSKKWLASHPVKFIAYDLLEWEGQDIRSLPFLERRKQLESLLSAPVSMLKLSTLHPCQTMEEADVLRQQAVSEGAEGLMIKCADSGYVSGRKRGVWWKWKRAPLHIDAVLLYAQAGHGRRANLYTDYTFAVWQGDQLVPFAKAYSGLTDAEIREVDAWIKAHTLDRFGPVRQVSPGLVFELGFEQVQPSKRHKSGVAVRFPRILRWRRDKKAEEANQLEDLMQWIKA